jgi:hypothetical protein
MPAARFVRILAMAAFLALPCGFTRAADWAELRGRFLLSGQLPLPNQLFVAAGPCVGALLYDATVVVDPLDHLANVVVTLRRAPAQVAPRSNNVAAEAVQLDFACQPSPHVAVVRTGQTLRLKNANAFDVGFQFVTLTNAPWTPAVPAGKTVERVFATAEGLPVRVQSSTHPWMNAWLVVRDHPYTAVSAGDGTFRIADLPVGTELEFLLWHERPGPLRGVALPGGKTDPRGRFKITLRPGINDLGEVILPVESFQHPLNP